MEKSPPLFLDCLQGQIKMHACLQIRVWESFIFHKGEHQRI